MESFYGGQQGFSFVVKRNPASDNGYFNNLNDINTAIATGDLRYGDYAIVTGLTGTGNSYNSEHGDLYRINTKNQPERVANISHPALSTLIKGFNSFNNNVDVSQTTSINFLDLNLSKQQSTLDLSWEYEEDNGVITGIRIGIKAPQPVIEFTIAESDNYKKTITETSDNNYPFYKTFQVNEPKKIDIKSKDTVNLIEAENLSDNLIFLNTAEFKQLLNSNNFEVIEEPPQQISFQGFNGSYYERKSKYIDISSYNNFSVEYEGDSSQNTENIFLYFQLYDINKQVISQGGTIPELNYPYPLNNIINSKFQKNKDTIYLKLIFYINASITDSTTILTDISNNISVKKIL